jgi:hypothetical protein
MRPALNVVTAASADARKLHPVGHVAAAFVARGSEVSTALRRETRLYARAYPRVPATSSVASMPFTVSTGKKTRRWPGHDYAVLKCASVTRVRRERRERPDAEMGTVAVLCGSIGLDDARAQYAPQAHPCRLLESVLPSA